MKAEISRLATWMPQSRRFVVVAFTCGAGLGILVALAGLRIYQSSPRRWDKKSLRETRVESVAQTVIDGKLHPVGVGFSFSVDLQNMTNADIALPGSAAVMQETKGSHALHVSSLKLVGDYLIPAGRSETVVLDYGSYCYLDEDEQGCFNANFRSDDEILLLDQSNRREIEIPISTPNRFGDDKQPASVRSQRQDERLDVKVHLEARQSRN